MAIRSSAELIDWPVLNNQPIEFGVGVGALAESGILPTRFLYANRCPLRSKTLCYFFTILGGNLGGGSGFFRLALSAAVLMSSISLLTRAALLPRSLSK